MRGAALGSVLVLLPIMSAFAQNASMLMAPTLGPQPRPKDFHQHRAMLVIAHHPTHQFPATLTVPNGVARTPAAEGTVSPQGVLALRGRDGIVRQGQIDAQGNATAKFVGAECVYTSKWRKAGH